MKRKEYEDKYDDFSSVYLSSPSSKSRRLDPNLVSFLNEDPRSTVPQVAEPLLQEQHLMTGSNVAPTDALATIPSDGCHEKALVLYNPTKSPLFKSPTSPDFSIIVNSDLIPGLRDHLFWSGNSKTVKPLEEIMTKEKNTTDVSDNRLVVVPWIASRTEAQSASLPEPMEAEEVEMMDADECSGSGSGSRTATQLDGVIGAEGLQQWQLEQQQYCFKPELFRNTYTPVTW